MKRLITYTVAILATLAVLLILWQFRFVIFLFVLSLFIAAAIRPFVQSLSRRGLSTSWSQLLLYILVIGGLLVTAVLLSDAILQELNSAANWSVVAYESFHTQWEQGDGWQQAVIQMMPQPFVLEGAEQGDGLGLIVPALMRLTSGLTGSLAAILLLIASSIYWSADQDRFERLLLSLLPPTQRVYVRDSWREIESSVGAYIRSQTVQSVLTALVLGIGSYLVGFPFPLLAALIGAVATVVPVLGGILAALALAALGSLEGVGLAITMGLMTLLVFAGLNIAMRRWFRPDQELSLLLTFILLIPLTQTFAIWGLIMTPPLAIALELLLGRAYTLFHLTRPRAQRSPSDLIELNERYVALHNQLDPEDGTGSPELRDLLNRLAQLLNDSGKLDSEEVAVNTELTESV